MEYFRKEYKLSEDTINKIRQLMTAEEIESGGLKVYEKDIVINAINYYHSAKFGKDVFDNTINKLELVLGQLLQRILVEHTQVISDNVNKVGDTLIKLLNSSNVNKQASLISLVQQDVIPDAQSIRKQLYAANSIERVVREVLEELKNGNN